MKYSTKQFDVAIKNKGMNYTNNCQGGKINSLLTTLLLYLEYPGWLWADWNWSIAKLAQAEAGNANNTVITAIRGRERERLSYLVAIMNAEIKKI